MFCQLYQHLLAKVVSQRDHLLLNEEQPAFEGVIMGHSGVPHQGRCFCWHDLIVLAQQTAKHYTFRLLYFMRLTPTKKTSTKGKQPDSGHPQVF
jgi:hypothetical protein